MNPSTITPTLQHSIFRAGRAGGNRTPNQRFWRPLLYQLSYRPIPASATFGDPNNQEPQLDQPLQNHRKPDYAITSVTRPAPIVRPPSRMAKRCPLSMATGAITVISTDTLSPGITISTPAGRATVPVTSVVRK